MCILVCSRDGSAAIAAGIPMPSGEGVGRDASRREWAPELKPVLATGPGLRPGVNDRDSFPGLAITLAWCIELWCVLTGKQTPSALPLLVPWVGAADHHHVAVPANHFATVTDRLDARLNLHRADFLTWSGVRPARPVNGRDRVAGRFVQFPSRRQHDRRTGTSGYRCRKTIRPRLRS